MEKVTIAPFHLLGLSKRTSNQNNQAIQDIGALWQQWSKGKWSERIPHLLSQEFCCVYTNYEGDYMAPYDVILGHKVRSLENIPEGLVGHTVVGGTAAQYTAQAPALDQAIGDTWRTIWSIDLKRAYQSDFELYSLDFSQASIYVGLEE
ncbi:MAG: GyrI-like domain-containing protein [Aureispira sp.]